MNLLFICSQNRLRSPTAEALFSEYDGIETISAGTNNDAVTPLSGDLVEWADVIFVMERTHRAIVVKRFGDLLEERRLVVLGIPDIYEFMQPELVAILKRRVEAILDL